MMWPLSTRAAMALTESHRVDWRAVAHSPGVGSVEVPVAGGTVTSDAGSQVRRSATIDVADPTLWPEHPLALLSPFGAELQVDYGIVLPGGGTEWVPLIRGVISGSSRTYPVPSGPVTVDLVDRSARVAEDRLDAPMQTASGATAVAEITRLIRRTLGEGQDVRDVSGSSQVAPRIEIEREVWADGIEPLADAIGCEVYFDQTGAAVIRRQPTLSDAAVWTVSDGVTGILVEAREALTRERVYNRVVASGERTDGSTPVYAGVSDLDPASPTFYGGPFGRRPRFYTSPLLTSAAQCTAAAASLLERARGISAAVTLEAVVHPGLEPGDVITVVRGGAVQRHIVDRVTVPLSVGAAQLIETRSVDLPPES